MHNEEKKERFALTGLFKKKNALFLAGVAGILLIGLSDFLFFGDTAQAEPTASTGTVEAAQYLETLEARLTNVLESVDGAGKVRVMVTLESGGETVFALDEQTDTTTQEDSGTQVQRKNSYQSEHILYDSGTGETPLVEVQTEPEIRGVAVVCEGGDDITVVKRITELVSVVLDLSTNRICVTKMI